jgi:choice-of-anchor B domain-containing protein
MALIGARAGWAPIFGVLVLLAGQIVAAAAGAHGDEPHPDDLPPGDATGGSGIPCVGGSVSAGDFEFACQNIDLLGWTDLIGIPSFGSDIWGWTDPVTGTPWAIIGLFDGTAFVDLSDPESPQHVATLPTASGGSFWADVKVYEDHAYVVKDEAGDHGLQVLDLRQLRFLNGGPVTLSPTTWYTGFGFGHNLAVNEETGFLYVLGSDTCAGSLHVLDLVDPANPVFDGCFAEDGYTHDAQCVVYAGLDPDYLGREICFNANQGSPDSDENTLTIVDVTDKEVMTLISRTGYPASGYAHQGWLTEDHAYFLFGDEADEIDFGNPTRTLVWDVRDLDQPVLVGHHESALASTDHNLYVRGDYVFQANYSSGLRVLRIVDPATAALEEVAYFDTYSPNDLDGTRVGAWGVYPFFDGDFVVVSDILLGLFVLRPQLVPEPSGALLQAAALACVGALAAVGRRRA